MVREYFKNSTNDTTEHGFSKEYKSIANTESNTINLADIHGQICNNLNIGAIKHRHYPKIDQRIKYLLENNNQWKEATIISRSGKATGQCRN